MRVLLWHVHGSWTTAFVQGPHEYFVPVVPDRGPEGRGRARTYPWPPTVHEMTREAARDVDVDVVVLQRPIELERWCEEWLGRRPGRHVPAAYVEHNAPQGRIDEMVHPVFDRRDILLVHVTHFNACFWDAGVTPTRVIEHGIVDPGHRYRGDLPRLAAVINEPVRRGRVTGTDLLGAFRTAAPMDLFGIGAAELGGIEDLPQCRLHAEMARRRVYVHPNRWTSLGLSLLEAMQLGMPVVALGTTAVADAIAPGAGAVSTRLDVLVDAARRLVADPDEATERGCIARRVALERFGLARFLHDWDSVLEELAR
jgi:hypothetical protein